MNTGIQVRKLRIQYAEIYAQDVFRKSSHNSKLVFKKDLISHRNKCKVGACVLTARKSTTTVVN